MKNGLATGIFIVLTTTACAPVASSVPKMLSNNPRAKDTVILSNRDSRKSDFEIENDKQVKVVSLDEYKDYEKNLNGERYKIEPVKSEKVSEFRRSRSVSNLKFKFPRKRADAVVIFVVNRDMGKALESQIKLDFSREDQNDFSFKVSSEGDSGKAWSTIEKDLDSVMIAYRETETKN